MDLRTHLQLLDEDLQLLDEGNFWDSPHTKNKEPFSSNTLIKMGSPCPAYF
jgi:hypothetical protein